MIPEKTNIDTDVVIKDMNRRAMESTAFDAVLAADPGARHGNIYRNHQSLWVLRNNMPLTKTDVVLEFGCGTGRLIFNINNACKKIIGVDISDKMIEAAQKMAADRKADNVTFIHTAGKIPVEDGSVDKVYIFWVFSLMPDTAIFNALNEFNRILKPGGKVYIFDHTSPKGTAFGQLQLHRKSEHMKEILSSGALKITNDKMVLRHPSRGMSLWNQIHQSRFTFLLPLLQRLDDLIVMRKPEFVNYYTEFFELTKGS